MNDSKLWVWLDQTMSALRPRNRAVAMGVDAIVILACWHLTYLFRLASSAGSRGGPGTTTTSRSAWCSVTWSSWPSRRAARLVALLRLRRLQARRAGLPAGRVSSAVVVLMAQLSGVARAVLLLHRCSAWWR